MHDGLGLGVEFVKGPGRMAFLVLANFGSPFGPSLAVRLGGLSGSNSDGFS